MVVVDVIVAVGVDEVADFELRNVCDQVSQQRVGADIKGYAEALLGKRNPVQYMMYSGKWN